MKQLKYIWDFIKLFCTILVLSTLATGIYTAKYTPDGKCSITLNFNVKETK